jgi:hypothetical protein
MRVTTKELREATLLLLKHLDDTGQTEFEIDEDCYWSVPQDGLYDPYNTPNNLTLGQLSHDWEEVRSLVQGKREPLAYVMVWLAAVMRRVGEKANG